ncbi:hypothetical protein B0I35DRAFT_364585 [Stachybotrys elegans]|uniref:Uncharacterized protein n=1 Tax=Stachybotrys elegans TaxID=80388 RepID=A0A8K0SC27_9HYPO|nr:hypothetical protein B0I35DRAFT_364585 [Stachybotrys elegans]
MRLRPETVLPLISLIQHLAYHGYSIWLFSASDIKTIVAPSFLFSFFTALALGRFGISSPPEVLDLLYRSPRTLFWIWINLMTFVINNQRRPCSILEDTYNKPWRPMPSKRLTQTQALVLVWSFHQIAIAASFYLGGTRQCLILILLGYWYNQLGGGDDSVVVRSLINTGGYMQFTTGALEVLAGKVTLTRQLFTWQVVIAAIIFSTGYSQDMPDQRGDAKRGRRTVPLVVGDLNARWLLGTLVVFWSVFCPVHLGSSFMGYTVITFLGAVVATRFLLLTSCQDDARTFKIWNLWLAAIFTLPAWSA